MAEKLTKQERRRLLQRRRRQIIGAVFLFFAVVGVISVVGFVVSSLTAATDDTEIKQDYQKLIAPLVSLDPAPFETLDDADQDVLLESAIWAALEYEDQSKYERNEAGSLLLPTPDIERYYSAMFGSHELTHGTFTDADLEYVYLEETGCYVIPITSQGGSYSPVIESMTQKGKTRVLTVAYTLGSSSAAELIENPSAVVVSKRMEYVMTREGKSYHISAIRKVETDEQG